ncbi:MAG: hypothetical protein ACRDN6_11455 [Gaiellaceae bacterium]
MHHGHRHRGHGFRLRRYPTPEEWLDRLEQHQRDLEQETANVAELIRRLKEGKPADTAQV